MSWFDDADTSASQALLTAALGGLLCLASPACGGSSTTTNAPISSSDTPVPSTECDGGVSPNPQVVSTMSVVNMTHDQFTAQCEAQAGIVEVQPHCGGSNSCRGMSYDVDTQTLAEHTCRATNTCAGYNCVICD